MSTLKGCDMVLAISQDTINFQFSSLITEGIISKIWNVILYENSAIVNLSALDFKAAIEKEDFDCAFNATISDPEMLILKNESKTVNLFIPFESGTMYYWKGYGKKATMEKVNMENWKYAFKVQIGSIEKSVANDPSLSWMITEHSKDALENVIAQSGLDQKYFRIESLFLDFENANYADYDAKNSYIPIDNTQLSAFQNLLSNYFKTLKGTDNPYILGYAVKVKDVPHQEEAMFQPTALKYSTTYNEDPDLAAFNFLMVTNKEGVFSDAEDVGVFSASLITDASVDGELVMNAKLFCNKIFEKLNLQEIYSDTFKSVVDNSVKIDKRTQNHWYSSLESLTLNPPNLYEGELKAENYGMSCYETPFTFTIEGTSGSSAGYGSTTEFNEITSVVSYIEFFQDTIDVVSTSKTVKVELIKPGEFSAKKRTKEQVEFKYDIPKFKSEKGNYPLGLAITTYSNSAQRCYYFPSDGIKRKYKGSCQTTVPQCTLYKFEAGARGKITIESRAFEPETKASSSDGMVRSLDESLKTFNNDLKNALENLNEKIEDTLKNLSTGNIIFPCNQLYTFKSLRFEGNPSTTKIDDNTVRVKVTYSSF